MRKRAWIVGLTALWIVAPHHLSAKPSEKEETNALFQALSACRGISEAAARLACYDRASSQLAEAVERRDVVVLDRKEIRQTRRSLFGFSLPRIPLFRGEGGEDVDELEAVIASAGDMGMGNWQIRLEDGAVWQTTEARSGLRTPKSGQKVVIKKGALGNYFIRIDGQRGIRGKRVS